MPSIKVCERKSLECQKYLDGSFSKQQTAIPLETLSLQDTKEIVTFEIFETSQIVKPSWIKIWLQAMQIKDLWMILFPYFLILNLKISQTSNFNFLNCVSSLFALIFLFLSFRLQNECRDHFSGRDRFNPFLGTRVLQKGWLKAYQVQRAAWVLLGLAGALSLPIFIFNPILMLLSAGTFLILISFIYFQSKISPAIRDILPGIVIGPILWLGICACGEQPFSKIIFLQSVLWSWLYLFHRHLKHFRDLFFDDSTRAAGWISTLGLDKARLFLVRWWCFALLIFFLEFFNKNASLYFWILGLGVCATSFLFARKVLKVKSPLGSAIREVPLQGYRMLLAMVFLWIFEILTHA